MGWNEDRKHSIKKQMKAKTKILKQSIKNESWMQVRLNLIDLKYMLNQLENMEEEE